MKLFCRTLGNGPPLIILHGLFGSSDNWISIAKLVGDYYTVYLPDMRNHGQSPHSQVMNYDAMSDDICDLADRNGLSSFFLAGHSMGGKAAMTFASRFPEKISGMLIADISPFVNRYSGNKEFLQHRNILEAMSQLNLSSMNSRTEADNELKKKIVSEKIRGFIMKNLQRSEGNNLIWKLNISSLLNNLEYIMDGIDLNKIPEKQITGFPVIFLKGMTSEYISRDEYPEILKLYPAAEIIEISEAGHWLHAERPEEVAKYLLRLSDKD